MSGGPVALPTAEQAAALFQNPVVRGTRKARIGLVGPSGSGKTYTALRMAKGLGGKIGLLDTEHKSSQLYADQFPGFLPVYMDAPYTPQRYIGVIHAAKLNAVEVLVLDSLSHAWSGAGGVLEQVDVLKAGNNANTQAAWSKMTPVQQQLIEAILSYPGHVIATMRTKDAYGPDPENPRKRVKVGLAPVQRNEVDYEFDVILYLDQQHTATVEKSRVSAVLPVNAQVPEPGEDVARAIGEWLASGAAETPPPATPAEAEAPPTAAPAENAPQAGASEPAPAPGAPTAPSAGSDALVTLEAPDGVRHNIPAGSVSGLLAIGWKVYGDPPTASSAGTPPPSEPGTAPSGAPPASPSGTSDSPGFDDAVTPGQVEAISEAVGRLAELEPNKDWPGKVHASLVQWFGEGTDVTRLSGEQATTVLDRLGLAERKVREDNA